MVCECPNTLPRHQQHPLRAQDKRFLPEMASVVPPLSWETVYKAVLSKVLGVMVSWLDTFVETTDNIFEVGDAVEIVVELSVFVNPEAVGKQGGEVRI